MAIHILQWKCRSIRNKILDLQSYLSTLANLPDVLCLQETYLNKQIIFFNRLTTDKKRSK